MRAIVFGATSGIAQEVLRLWAARGDELYLVARNAERLEAIAGDLRMRGAGSVRTAAADLNDTAAHQRLFEDAGSFDTVLVAHGVMGDETDVELVMRTNLCSPAALLTAAAERAQPGARLAAIGSVAGDRGRAKNGLYGASKAGLEAFLSALRQRMFRRGVRVITVKPGFVDTAMTAHMPKSRLFAKPARVARDIVRALDRGTPVAYVPGFWRLIMAVVRAIPETLFRRLAF
jgi:decaprenylphospho-beta-D-erythro-pentofuranosid-2-ulose 2-reductase